MTKSTKKVWKNGKATAYPKVKESGEDAILGTVVGQDNITGKTLVADGAGSTFKVPLEGELIVSTEVVVERAKAEQGGRKVSADGKRTVKLVQVTPLATKSAVGQADIDRCNTGGGSTPPSPPDEPEEPEPEPPPPQPPVDPQQPEEPDETPTPPEGCSPDSNCQWYNTSESGATSGSGCPAGTSSKGFAQLSGNRYMVLCCGEGRPAGDGCPEDPTTYGYGCVNGSCELVPNGLYATLAECEIGCTQPEEPPVAKRYTCSGTTCLESPTGEYSSLSDCQAGCKKTPGTRIGYRLHFGFNHIVNPSGCVTRTNTDTGVVYSSIQTPTIQGGAPFCGGTLLSSMPPVGQSVWIGTPNWWFVEEYI